MFKLVENKTPSCTNIKEVKFHAQPAPSKSIQKITKFLWVPPSNYYSLDSICMTNDENIALIFNNNYLSSFVTPWLASNSLMPQIAYNIF